MEGKTMQGMDDARNACPVRRHPPECTRLGAVGVDDLDLALAQDLGERSQCHRVVCGG